jgi:hypothetical protein
MMSPTAILLWEIWRQHRSTLGAILALTATGQLIDFLERGGSDGAGSDSNPLTVLLAMMAFLLLLGVFNYTETGDNRGLGRFPRRLFTLPVTSLRLVTVPMLSAIASMVLLYLLWIPPLTRGGTVSPVFVAVLVGSLAVFYLCTLWTLERAGSLRLIAHGVIAIAMFVVGMLPSLPPTPPPLWRSQIVLAGMVAGLAGVAFLLAWRHIDRLRTGGDRSPHGAESIFGRIAAVRPARRHAFDGPAAAHFWFEWRASGTVLPGLIGSILVIFVLPVSLMVSDDAGDTFRLLLATLAMPIVLAVPVGIAFSKPTFWSEDLAVPAFVAIRPVSSADLVAIKLKVAAMSAALSWLVVLVFVTVWLSFWGHRDVISRLGIQLWALHWQSVPAVYGIAMVVVLSGMVLTWRSLVSRLWSGLGGNRRLFVGSVLSIVVIVIAGTAFDADRLPRWLLDDPARLAPLAWAGALAVIAKYWMAARVWRDVPPRHLRLYLPVWLAGTASLLALAMVFWGMVRLYVPLDVDRVRSLFILAALLAVPLARVGLAPSSLTRNRHRWS